jgi:hypothetical protein
MGKEPPFDVWDGEGLEPGFGIEAAEPDEPDTAEEAAMHVDPESEVDGRGSAGAWSELTGQTERDARVRVSYFADEQPDVGVRRRQPPAEHELDLEELLERQHYAFPERS